MKEDAKGDVKEGSGAAGEVAAKLQAGRARMAERCMAVAKQHLPERTMVEYRKVLSGRAWPRNAYGYAKIQAPRPVTRNSLYIFLHEAAHVRLHDPAALKERRRTDLPRYLQEYEAELQAHQWMRAAGIPVPRRQTRRAKRYVARKIRQACLRGARRIAKEALEFAGVSAELLEQWQQTCQARRNQG